MYKNLLIMLLIVIIPIITYFSLTHSEKNLIKESVSAEKAPQIIKFSSSMCSDCQKMEKLIKEVFPPYKEKIKFVEINVQNKDKMSQDYIKKYKITLVPTIIYLDKNGNQWLKTEGFVEKNEFKKDLEGLIK